MSTRPIRVLVIDDSALVRKLASEALAADPQIEVVGTAIDPIAAEQKFEALRPDVLTLDLEMPRMDGLTYLRQLMSTHPRPVIVMSSLTQSGSHHALEALRLGAVDVIGKPNGSYSFGDLGPQLIEKVKAAFAARLRPRGTAAPFAPEAPHPQRGLLPAVASRCDPRRLILLGASTGGTEALRSVLTELSGDLPGIAVVQHIPALFSHAFAERLNRCCAFEVREAADGDRLVPGLALVAPGNRHMLLQWSGDAYRVRLNDGPPVWHQRPAVDLLFRTAADAAGPHAIAGVLTGMGKDGAEGLLRLREKGALTFSQDEASCVVYGMPRAAWELGGSQRQVPLDRMAAYITQLAHQTVRAPAAAARA